MSSDRLLNRLLVAGAATLIAAVQALALRALPEYGSGWPHDAASLASMQQIDARFAGTAICLYFGLVAWYYVDRRRQRRADDSARPS
jgi:hypothetical protein